jgi:hypothetical protein
MNMGPEKPRFPVTALFSFPKCQCIILVTMSSNHKMGRDWCGITDTHSSQSKHLGYTSASTELTSQEMLFI